MSKYTFEFKLKVVKAYLNSHSSLKDVGAEYGIDHSVVRLWSAYYRKYGEEGLKPKQKQRSYSFEFKLHTVQLYLESNLSYLELALQERVNNPNQIRRWVTAYKANGPEALRPIKKGQKQKMEKEDIIRMIENGDSEEQKELLKQLQNENLRLRIENAFLKEMRRLRLEEEKLLNESRESSTVSEENSN